MTPLAHCWNRLTRSERRRRAALDPPVDRISRRNIKCGAKVFAIGSPHFDWLLSLLWLLWWHCHLLGHGSPLSLTESPAIFLNKTQKGLAVM